MPGRHESAIRGGPSFEATGAHFSFPFVACTAVQWYKFLWVGEVVLIGGERAFRLKKVHERIMISLNSELFLVSTERKIVFWREIVST